MKKFSTLLAPLILTALLATVWAVPSFSPPPRTITGIYECTGKGPDGHDYRGQVTIRKEGEVYLLTWVVGPEKYTGIGIREDETLAVSFSGPPANGIVLYRLNESREPLTFEGKWTIPGISTVQAETLIRIRR